MNLSCHLAISSQHGTPTNITNAVKNFYKNDVIDICSSHAFNQINQFPYYLTEADNGLTSDWYSLNVFCNPPGSERDPVTKKLLKRGLVKDFWDEINKRLEENEIDSAIWIGYSLEQLQTLQNTKYKLGNLYVYTVVDKRLIFLKEDGSEQKNPVHGNWIGLLTNECNEELKSKYIRYFSEFGFISQYIC